MGLLAIRFFQLLYGLCFAFLLWQAFRVMARGFKAASDKPSRGKVLAGSPSDGNDRTGQVTVHPELLDEDGRLTREDLLTVRFGVDGDGLGSKADEPEASG